MKLISGLLVLSMAALAAGCSSTTIRYDYDGDADFDAYGTYAWIPQQRDDVSGDARTAVQRNSLLDKRIKQAVSRELVAKGLRPDAENPQLLLAYHTGVQDKVEVTDWGYSYGRSYYGWHGSDISVYNYQEGTLIVDIIDAETKQLVWRGIAQGTLSENPSPGQVEQRLNDVAAKMFQYYPPKKK